MGSIRSKEDNVVSTGMKTEKRAFTWKITDFNVVRTSSDAIGMQQMNFEAGASIGMKSEFNCFLWERKKMLGGEETSWIGVYMRVLKQPVKTTEIHFVLRMKIPRANGSLFIDAEAPVQNICRSQIGFPWVIRKDAALKDLPLVNGSLILELEVTMYAPQGFATLQKNSDEIGEIEKKFKVQFTSLLQADLVKLLCSSSEYSDSKSKIITKDKVEYGVNMGVIMARCPVFGKMLELQGKDSKKDAKEAVFHSGLSSKTMSVLLRFIYTGTLHTDWASADVIAELVYVAGLCKMNELLQFFDQVLGKIVTKETGGKLLRLAKECSLKKAENDIFVKMKKEMSNLEEMAAFLKKSASHNITFD